MRAQANPTRPLRVLIVHDSLSENGGVRLTLDVADRLVALGASCEVFALQPVRDGRAAAPSARVTVTHGVPAGGRLRSSGLAALRRLFRACRRADVVVSGSEVGLGLLAGFGCARAARRPFAVVVHAPLDAVLERWVPPRLRRATAAAHRRVDAAICVSRAVAAGVSANGLEAERVHVVPNAIDVESVRRSAADAVPRDGLPVVVGVGRLSPEKGFDLLVRAHAEVRRAGVRHALELIGDGPDRESLVRLAAECGVEESVVLPGFVEDAAARIARAAAVVLPSRHEGMPLVLLEALALGVPVLASRSAAAAELLSEEHLFEDESVTGLAGALTQHLTEPEPLARATASAVSAALARTPEDMARAYLAVCDRLARQPAAAGRAQAARG